MRTASLLRSCARLRRAYGVGLLIALPAAAGGQVLATAAASGTRVPEHALVRGLVFDDVARTPVVDAVVMLLDTAGELVAKIGRTDSAGFFELVAPATGGYRVLVRRDGYAAVVTSEIAVASGESVQVELPLAVGGEPATRPVLAGREPIGQLHWAPEQFERRRAAHAGTFAGPRELRRALAEPVRELLARFGWRSGAKQAGPDDVTSPAARVVPVASAAPPSQAGCAPAFRVNGEPADHEEANLLLLSTAELRAVEYYRPGEVPAELAEGSSCGVVVLWTR